jgi:hypothetical protein
VNKTKKPRKYTPAEIKRRQEAMRKVALAKHERELKIDPRKRALLKYYYDPDSDTYSNLLRSALKAGYRESYARSMSHKSKNKWIDIENYEERTSMTADHITSSFENIALKSVKEENRLKALEMLAKLKGMMIEKKITATVNIEDILSDVEVPNEVPNETEDKDVIDL